MIQDFPGENGVLPVSPPSTWIRLKDYEIEEKQGIKFIIARDISHPESYNLFDFKLPDKQPNSPKEWNSMPHLHLARLDISSTKSILEFVTKWGPLGLCETKYSSITEDILLQTHIHQEPLNDFIMAVKEFQDLCNNLSENLDYNNQDQIKKNQDILNTYIGECKPFTFFSGQWMSFWNAPSLLHICYLYRWLDLLDFNDYHRCEHKKCSNIYIRNYPDQDYCSKDCKRQAKRLRNYYKNKVRQLWANGQNIGEISKKTRADIDQINKWIEEFKKEGF